MDKNHVVEEIRRLDAEIQLAVESEDFKAAADLKDRRQLLFCPPLPADGSVSTGATADIDAQIRRLESHIQAAVVAQDFKAADRLQCQVRELLPRKIPSGVVDCSVSVSAMQADIQRLESRIQGAVHAMDFKGADELQTQKDALLRRLSAAASIETSADSAFDANMLRLEIQIQRAVDALDFKRAAD